MALYAVETIIFKIYNIMKLQKVIALVAFVCFSTAEKQGQNPGESSYAVKMRLKQQQAELKELKKKKKTVDTAIKTK